MNSKAINKLDLVLNLTSFKKFTEKHLYQCLFFNKAAGLGQKFLEEFSPEHLLTTASDFL